MATVLPWLTLVSVVGILHSDAAASDGVVKCESKPDGSCADVRLAQETDRTYLVQLKLHKENRVQSAASSHAWLSKDQTNF